MKPLLTSLLVSAVLLQAPAAFSQDRGGRDNHGPVRPGDNRPGNDRHDDRRDNDRRDREERDRRDREERDRREREERDRRRHNPPRRDPNPPPRYPDYPRHPTYPSHPNYPTYPNYPNYPTYPTPPSSYDNSVYFSDITRRSGGEWVRVNFSYASYVDHVRAYASSASILVHEAILHTQSGRQLVIRNLASQMLYPGNSYTSEYITAGERIVAIDLRLESYGNYGDVRLTVSSSNGTPQIYAVRYP